MTWYTDDRHFYWEQRRLDAAQRRAEEARKHRFEKRVSDSGYRRLGGIEACAQEPND